MGPGMGGRGRGSQRYGPSYGPPPPEYGPHADSPVLMVYGLEPSKVNADKVFNIFCLYGNVERVRRGFERWSSETPNGMYLSCLIVIAGVQ